jgi:aspartate/methionine/tyrosine aminotransferase
MHRCRSRRLFSSDVEWIVGHAGSRFGWALVRDKEVANLMEEFIQRVEIAVSEDSQFRSLNLIRSLLGHKNGDGHSFFSFMHAKMKARWQELSPLFANQTRFSLLSEPNTFYAWISCNYEADRPCVNTLRKAHVAGWPGSDFGVSDQFVRLELVERDSTFAILAQNLRKYLFGK